MQMRYSRGLDGEAVDGQSYSLAMEGQTSVKTSAAWEGVGTTSEKPAKPWPMRDTS